MKVVIGLFRPDEIEKAVNHMLANGYQREALGVITTADEIPDYLEPEAEEAAVNGSVVGAAAGGVLGALGGVAVSTMMGMEASVLYGLMSTATGGAIGTYLGSIYNVRAESQASLNVRDALMTGDVVLVVEVDESQAESAAAMVEAIGGRQVGTHTVAQKTTTDEPDAASQINAKRPDSG